jgi:hypothetical protein
MDINKLRKPMDNRSMAENINLPKRIPLFFGKNSVMTSKKASKNKALAS